MWATRTIEFQDVYQYITLRALIWREIELIKERKFTRGDERRALYASELRALRYLYNSIKF